jgi:hypothetical protein
MCVKRVFLSSLKRNMKLKAKKMSQDKIIECEWLHEDLLVILRVEDDDANLRIGLPFESWLEISLTATKTISFNETVT